MGLYTPALVGFAAGLVLDRMKIVPAASISAGFQLSRQYRGPAMLVRRSSDSTTDAIYYKNGLLDTTSLLAFAGTGNAYVNTIYGQSGSGGNFTQSVAADQPQIVAAGVVNKKNGVPCMLFNAPGTIVLQGAKFAQPSTNFWVNQLAYAASLSSANVTGTDALNGGSGGYRNNGLYTLPGQALLSRSGVSTALTPGGTAVANTLDIQTLSYLSANSATLFRNGVAGSQVTGISFTTGAASNWYIGLYDVNNSASMNGGVCEFMASAGQVLDSYSQAVLEIDQARRYGISGVTQ